MTSCPDCGSDEKGRTVYKCKECGHKGCFKANYIDSPDGCWPGQECPYCGAYKKYFKIGVIWPKD